MTNARIIIASLRHHWRIHFAVALGVAAATAVLTGALIIGDSVRGSLRHLVLDRLGKIDRVLVLDRFFRQELATELAKNRPQALVAPAILFPAATVQAESSDGKRLASGITIIGSDESYWQLESAAQRPKSSPKSGEIIINAPLAE
jgi:putative ABC transport system permease protein